MSRRQCSLHRQRGRRSSKRSRTMSRQVITLAWCWISSRSRRRPRRTSSRWSRSFRCGCARTACSCWSLCEAGDPAYDYAKLASLVDGLILMNYDEHFEQGAPGPLAGQGWYEALLDRHFKGIDRSKLIVGIGSYGYDWAGPGNAREISVQEAWELLEASARDPAVRRGIAQSDLHLCRRRRRPGAPRLVPGRRNRLQPDRRRAGHAAGGSGTVAPRNRRSRASGLLSAVAVRADARALEAMTASKLGLRRPLQGPGRGLERHRPRANPACASSPSTMRTT